MKVDRAIIIRREKDHEAGRLSREYAQQCADSCDRFELPWEYLTAVEDLPQKEAYASVGVTKVMFKPNQGNSNCHSSHIKAWKRIVEIGRCCVIFEHDAILKSSLKELDIPDRTVVTLGNRILDESKYNPIGPPVDLVKIGRSIGGHSYALTPASARYLYDNAASEGVAMGVDNWLFMKNKCGLPLYIADPPPAVCWDRPSTMPERKGRTYNARNFPDTLTEKWKRGLKNATK